MVNEFHVLIAIMSVLKTADWSRPTDILIPPLLSQIFTLDVKYLERIGILSDAVLWGVTPCSLVETDHNRMQCPVRTLGQVCTNFPKVKAPE